MAEWLARSPAKQEVCGSNPASYLTETRMQGKRLDAMLAIYTNRGVTPEVNLRECISHTPPQSSNKAEPTLALKPRGNRGISGPTKRTHVLQKILKKRRADSLICLCTTKTLIR